MNCRHYIVEGRVQGVFFRASTRDQAEDIGLKGWVRNLGNGHVEVVACGNERQLATLEIWLRRGPPMASVTKVKIEDWPEAPEFTDFDIR